MIVKNFSLTILFFLGMPNLMIAMQTKNWVPTRTGFGVNRCTIWKGTDNQEMVIIKYCRSKGEYSGKRIPHAQPDREETLSRQQLQIYLSQLNELEEKG